MRSVTTRLAGVIILIGGLWGALIPFVGPYFHYSLGPGQTWTWTTGRLYLDILPGIAAIIGGALLMASGPWTTGRVGALIALVAGIWFVVGPDLSYIWQAGGAQGVAHGSRAVRGLEAIGYHTGLGVLIAALAAYALPGFLRAPAPVAATEGALAGAGAATAVRPPSAAERRPVRERVPEAEAPAGAAPGRRPLVEREPVAGTQASAPAGPATAPTARTAETDAATPPAQRRRGGLLGGLFGGRRRKLGSAH